MHDLNRAAALLQPVKRMSWSAVGAASGRRIVDVGWGPGRDTVAMAGLVEPEGLVVEVEVDPGASAASARTSTISARPVYLQADPAHLPLGTGVMDGARSEQILQHCPDPGVVVEELVRVTRHGGRVVILEIDWSTFTVTTTLTGVLATLRRTRAELLRSPRAGSAYQLRRLAREAGLRHVVVGTDRLTTDHLSVARVLCRLGEVEEAARAAGLLSESELHAWYDDLDRYRDKAFRASLEINTVVSLVY
jgi:SAM-dependent methyltransferase